MELNCNSELYFNNGALSSIGIKTVEKMEASRANKRVMVS